jgi:hypothetical protein
MNIVVLDARSTNPVLVSSADVAAAVAVAAIGGGGSAAAT